MSRTETPPDAATDIVAQVDTGARQPDNWQGKLILWIAFIWAVFQLYIASNLPFWLSEHTGLRWLVVTNSDARRMHFAFALVLAAMAFPMFKGSSRDWIPWYDWVLIGLSIVVSLHAVVLREEIAVRAGLPTTGDLVVSSVGMLMGNLKGGNFFVEGWLARIMYISLYRMHQAALYGWPKTLLLLIAGKFSRMVRPRLKLH